jgi:hypothetical protein
MRHSGGHQGHSAPLFLPSFLENPWRPLLGPEDERVLACMAAARTRPSAPDAADAEFKSAAEVEPSYCIYKESPEAMQGVAAAPVAAFSTAESSQRQPQPAVQDNAGHKRPKLFLPPPVAAREESAAPSQAIISSSTPTSSLLSFSLPPPSSSSSSSSIPPGAAAEAPPKKKAGLMFALPPPKFS